jgi:hypothetical protein
VVVGTASAVSNKAASNQAAKAQAAAAPPPAPETPTAGAPAPAPAALSDDVYEQLKKLGELRDAGILTDEEFNAKKTQLLGL